MFKMKLAEKEAVLNGYQPYWHEENDIDQMGWNQ